jgi:phosphate transport system ATP-binding protein
MRGPPQPDLCQDPVLLDIPQDICGPHVDAAELRRRIGMVFQKPNPFAKSVYDNVAYGLRLHGVTRGPLLDEAVERALRRAVLWDEVKDRLRRPRWSCQGGSSSGGAGASGAGAGGGLVTRSAR